MSGEQGGADRFLQAGQAGSASPRTAAECGPKKKGAVRVSERPKSREETPKEGSDRATPIAMSQCTNSRVRCHKSSACLSQAGKNS